MLSESLAMPILEFTTPQIEAALADATPDILFIYDEIGIRPSVQAHLLTTGCKSVRRLAGAPTELALVLRKALNEQLALKEEDNLQARTDVADVSAAWTDARKEYEKESELRAEKRVMGIGVEPAPSRASKIMKELFEKLHGYCPKNLRPGRFLLGSKIEEVIENGPVVEALQAVTSKEDGEEGLLLPDLIRDGAIRLKKGAAKWVKMPATSEELRTRHRLICNAWLFVRTRHSTRAFLRGLDKESYNVLFEYILGEKGDRADS